eukprot:COSAG03_NODE_2393_length_2815_cov_1.312592_1_plen_129_part_00
MGWIGRSEAVKLQYDSTAPNAEASVVAAAANLGFIFVHEPSKALQFRLAKIGEGGHAGVSDQKHCLRLGRGGGAAGLDRVQLTGTQAMRANAACYAGKTRESEYPALSPRQEAQRRQALGTAKAKADL